MSALEDMERSAQSGADIERRTAEGETPDTQINRMYMEASALGYRVAVQQLRKLGLLVQAACLDVTGEALYGESYRTLPVEGEPKR